MGREREGGGREGGRYGQTERERERKRQSKLHDFSNQNTFCSCRSYVLFLACTWEAHHTNKSETYKRNRQFSDIHLHPPLPTFDGAPFGYIQRSCDDTTIRGLSETPEAGSSSIILFL